MQTFRLAHLSDPHLPPPSRFSWRDLGSKRLLSRLAWQRKRRAHDPRVLAAIVSDIKAQIPDHVVVTGDITNFATPEEFAAAAAWLEDLAPPESLTVSPGNHDALTGRAGPERFAPWRRWLGDHGDLHFPQVRRRGPVAFVNLCSAVPTAPHLAQGALGEGQLRRLQPILASLGEAGLHRIVLIHHPVTPGTVSRRKALRDEAELLQVLREAGAELVLHGHAHGATAAAAAGPNGPIPVLGAPSASAAGHGETARWHSIELETSGKAAAFRVIARGLAASGQIEELGRYELQAPQPG